MMLDDLNRLDALSAEREFLRCCGSSRWARQMTEARPFDDVETMAETADRIWASLQPTDWLEAFSAHPEIGSQASAPAATPSRGHANPRRGVSESSRRGWGPGASGKKAGAPGGWSSEEQAGVTSASDAVLDRLAAGNRDYKARFGYIFIVCATGRSADEMLAMLDERLANDPDDELRVAAEEQRKITRLRLAKLVDA
jgi:OHCU decarboxylase